MRLKSSLLLSLFGLFLLFGCQQSNNERLINSDLVTKAKLNSPPYIVTHPLNAEVCAPDKATFSIVPGGPQPYAFQWQKNGINILGANSQTYTTPPTTINDNGSSYRCILSNPYRTIRSKWAYLYIKTGCNIPPMIIIQPSKVDVCIPETATFLVSVRGSSPLFYQWQKNGINILGATQSRYTTMPTVLTDNGSTFRCIITNQYGTVTSNTVYLNVKVGCP